MVQWFKANGGWPAVLVVGLAVSGFTTRTVGFLIMVAAVAGWTYQHRQSRVSFLTGIAVVIVAVCLALFAPGLVKGEHRTSGTSVVSFHQSGGITAGTVNVASPRASAHVRAIYVNRQQPNGTYVTRLSVDVTDSYAIRLFRIDVWGRKILDVGEVSAGVYIMAGGQVTEAHGFFQAQGVPSSFLVDVVTADSEVPDIAVTLK